MKNEHALLNGRRRQRGAVMIMFGLTLVVLIGFAGLAIDLGRFFVVKAELQNAMDACALSAASQLRPGRNDANALTRAVAYGRVFTTGGTADNDAIKNRANFQSGVVAIADTQITFSATLMPDTNYQVSTTTDLYKTAQYAKCDYPLAGLPVYFMRVLNLIGLGPFTTQTVRAMAVATQGPQICNLIPVGVCPRAGMSGTSTPPYGFNVGDWLKLGDPDASQVRGWFHWIQFPGQANGANGLRDALLEKGDCVIPASASQPQGGTINVAEWAWNKRLGIYKDDEPATVPPDKTGYSYFNHTDPGTGTYFPWANWRNYPDTNPGTGARAFPHYTSTALPGFLNYRDSFLQNTPNSAVADPGILQPSNQYVASNGPTGEHSSFGRTDRRLVIIPIMNCTDTNVVQMVEDPVSNKPVLACALMLNPFGQVGGDKISGKIEYLGLVGAGSPCGNANVTGPNMSVLVK